MNKFSADCICLQNQIPVWRGMHVTQLAKPTISNNTVFDRAKFILFHCYHNRKMKSKFFFFFIFYCLMLSFTSQNEGQRN